MKKFAQIVWISLLWVVGFTGTAIAQTEDVAPEVEAAPPTVRPRFGIQYTTEGAGYDSLGSVEGFVPLFQTPGESATYLGGRVFLDNNSLFGGNVMLGYRKYNQERDRVFGSYVSYDFRNTDENNFNQLGLGVESLGKWDFRFNGYIPLGDNKEIAAQNFTGRTLFQGNDLRLERATLYDIALHGVDAEVGTRLTKIGSGDIRGYAGLYYYDGANSKEAFGWKTRLEARPSEFLGLGLSLQNDSLFDTRLVFSVGLRFLGSGAVKGSPNTNWARMSDFVQRQATIPVVQDLELDINTAATKPDGSALRFFQVAPGGSTIAQALTSATAGDIVYVTSSTLPGFTIKDGVQVLSSGPVQTVATREIGNVQLPSSGSNVLPRVTSTVTLGNNTVLSGFDVNGATGAGVRGTNISNVTISNNRIQNSILDPANVANLGQGILLDRVTGRVNITNNTINNNAETAVTLRNNAGAVDLTVANNQINNNFNAVQLNLSGTASGTAQITNNTITNSGIGVNVDLSGNAQSSNLNISNNRITGTLANQSQGIQVSAFNNARATVNVTGNNISTTSDDAIRFRLNNDSVTQANITGNTINNAQGNLFTDGIDLEIYNNATGIIRVADNRISNLSGLGFYLGGFGTSKAFTTINSNTMTGTGGVQIDAYDSARACSAINGNTISASNSINAGITLAPIDTTTTYQVVNASTVASRNNNVTVTTTGSGTVANVAATACPQLP
jgi:hypothetical protein